MMAVQVNVNEAGWTRIFGLIDSRQESEDLRARRFPWVCSSVMFCIGYLLSLFNHGFMTGDMWNIGYIVVLLIMGFVDGLLAGAFVKRILPEFKFRNIAVQACAKVICDFGGVYGCYILLGQIKQHTRGVCWMYVSCSAFSLAIFRVISPTVDFSIPNLLAQVAMNDSLLKEHKFDSELVIGVGFACFMIFVIQGMRDLNWMTCNMYNEEGNMGAHDDVGWTPRLRFFGTRVQAAPLRFQRLCWAFTSGFAIISFTLSYLFHITYPKINDKFPYWVVLNVMILACFVQWVLAFYNRLPQFRVSNMVAKAIMKIIFESVGVYACFYILESLKSHTHGICWMFFSLALYCLAFFKILSPSIDFSIPSLLAQIAMNESLKDDNKDDTLFKATVAVACLGIFAIQATLDFKWEELRNMLANICGNKENEIGEVHGEGIVGIGHGRGRGGGGGGRGAGGNVDGQGLEMVVIPHGMGRGVGRGGGANL